MNTVHFNVSDGIRGLHALKQRGPVAAARAINKSAVSARAVGAREIASEIGLRVNVVRDDIFIREATPERPIAELSVSGRRIPLIDFGAKGPEPSRGKGGGVTYRIGRGGRGRVRQAFIATMRSGHRGVFKRVGAERKSRGAWSKNLPIVELHGPSLPFIFAKERIVRAMHRRYEEAMAKNLPHEVEFELRRLGLRSS